MPDIVYFVPGNFGRFINQSNSSVIIGHDIHKEGYYIGDTVKRENCSIFYGKPYVPARTDIPSQVDFNPNSNRSGIIQDSIEYFLAQHKRSGAYFVICRYLIDGPSYKGKYFSDLLSVVDGEWRQIREWPFNARRYTRNPIFGYWEKYGNYYEEDFTIHGKLEG